MRRKFYKDLLEWKESNIETPLMVVGARQIGKTYIIEKFCKENFKEYITINLESEEIISKVFEETINPEEIISKIEIILNRKISIDTVIFLDEIQVSERAIQSLKYFNESEKSYKIITAGSLLGVKLNRFRSSFPVGKVIIKNMYPMDFEEFLLALEKDMWIEEIKRCYNTLDECIVHRELLELYRTYLCIGGMPICVLKFKQSNNDILLYDTSEVESIVKSYISDMGKYTMNTAETIRIETVYNSIPRQLGKVNKKFQYTILKSGATKSDYSSAIDWLLASNMITKVNLLNKIEIPLKPFENKDVFKIYFNDVGILTLMSEINFRDILLDKEMMFKGAIAENYIANQFTVNNIPLYYWESGNQAEIDYIIYNEDGIIPVEVKASINTQSKSLKVYMDKYNPKYAIRLSTKNFGFVNNIKSIPLYAAFCIER